MTPALVLAADEQWAERSAKWISDGAIVCVGSAREADVASGAFSAVVIGGELTNESWVSDAFAAAGRGIAPGGRVILVVAGASTERLPDYVAATWRVVGVTIEHPRAGVAFAPAADEDGAATTHWLFQRALAAARVYRSDQPEEVEGTEGPGTDPHEFDGEAAELRRQLSAYRNSVLGRLTTRYWRLRRRA